MEFANEFNTTDHSIKVMEMLIVPFKGRKKLNY